MDAAHLVVGDPVALLQVRVEFHLVDGGRDGGVAEELVELGGGEVGDADAADAAGAEEAFHGVPGGDVGDGRVFGRGWG